MAASGGPIAELGTERLRLRPFVPADAPRVHELANDERVAHTTTSIPHPHPEGAAAEWIAGHAPRALSGSGWAWAVERTEDGLLLDAISLLLTPRH
jgi:[ribosomal protein S5]-alanine N-acetyltransferase